MGQPRLRWGKGPAGWGGGGAAPLRAPGGCRRGAGPRGAERVARRGVSRDGGRGRSGAPGTRLRERRAGVLRPRAGGGLGLFPPLAGGCASLVHTARPQAMSWELRGAGIGAGADPRFFCLVSATTVIPSRCS